MTAPAPGTPSGRRRPALVDLLRTRRPQILAIAERHGVVSVKVFGSAARGDYTEASDVDFLIELEPDRNLLDLIGFQQDVSDALGVHVDVLTTNSVHPLIRDTVLAEAVPV